MTRNTIVNIVNQFHPLLWCVPQVVLWDKIVKRGDNAKIDVKSINTKYYFWDDGNGLR